MAEKLRLGVIGIGFAWDRLHYPAFRELRGGKGCAPGRQKLDC